MLKQHRELSLFVRHSIETNVEARIRLSKTYQSFVAAADSHWKLSFIEKDVRNYITRKLNLEGDHSIKNAIRANTRSRAACEYFEDVVSFDTTYNIKMYLVHRKRIRQKLERFCHKVRPWKQQVALRAIRRSNHHLWVGMRSIQKSEIHHTQQLLESIREAIRQLPSKQRVKRERIRRYRFSHRDLVHNKISNRGAVSACVYPREVYGNLRTIQRKGEMHHKINAFHLRLHNIRSYRAEVKCQCLLFESRDMLCRHSLSVLSFERVDN
ncbi:hypothetical protein Ahy_A05g022269 isoform A [Arachis hypogaea]|uniref:SWIM-type domain-containing protein n=1 Tax=Arachis hypogaea TaxID=3818 RepID=A0A445D054_ARAHY|nr:hypothetical protein Ahy_A05g022269 isoform A [Arachis hypogaea]